jgi:tRNA-dihydrouridine synthase A
VQDGRFGACLMAEPARVGDCVAAMKAAVDVPVTVKCRIGIDDQDPEQALDALADAVLASGCDALIVHARKAWLKGLSPKENRDVPPLDYGRVFRLKARLPEVTVSINGGIATLADALALLEPRDGVVLDGVMLGRAAYQSPDLLLAVDPLVFGEPAPHASARAAVESLFPEIEAHLARGGRLSNFTRHMLGLFQGRPGARGWRRFLSERAPRADAGLETLVQALDLVDDQALVRRAA